MGWLSGMRGIVHLKPNLARLPGQKEAEVRRKAASADEGEGRLVLLGCYEHFHILPSQPGPCRGEIQLPGPKLGALPAHQGPEGTANGGTRMFWKEGRVLMLFLILPPN